MGSLPAPTLYDDWRLRRERLLKEVAQEGDGYREVLIKLLDYLLKRYENYALVQQPARFPVHSEVVWKRRAILVHRHLRGKDGPPVRGAGEAQSRASRILSRIAATDPQKDAGTPGGGALGGGDFKGLVRASLESIPETMGSLCIHMDKMQFLCANFGGLSRSDQERLMRRWFEQLLPKDDGEASPYTGFDDAWTGLTSCGHRNALDYVFQLWKEYLRSDRFSYWLSETEGFLRLPSNRERTADLLRAELAGDRPPIRLRALTLLRELGSLDDVGLLSDLLALPKQEDEAPGEREAIMETLKALG
jgi:hypothetical protein